MLLTRIEAKQEEARRKANGAICCIAIIVLAPCGLAIRKKSQEDMVYYDDLIKLVTLRKNAAGPSHDISIPEDLLGRVKKFDSKKQRNLSNTNSSHYTDGHYFAYGAGCGYS